jgi:hypothetical protein
MTELSRESARGEPRWGKLPMRLGWVFKKPHRPDGGRAVLRAFWHVVLRGYVYEVCLCGRPVSAAIRTYWLAPDDLWERVNGRSEGVLCPRCFADRAAAQDITVAWLGARMEDVDRLVSEAR